MRRQINLKSWRTEKATKRQLDLIRDMQEFSYYPLPKFNFETATKGEAFDYIEKWSKLAHENVNSPTFGY